MKYRRSSKCFGVTYILVLYTGPNISVHSIPSELFNGVFQCFTVLIVRFCVVTDAVKWHRLLCTLYMQILNYVCTWYFIHSAIIRVPPLFQH